MNPAAVLAKKRDGGELSPGEIEGFLGDFQTGSVADYQMAAFLMAVCIRGMSPEETAVLTREMVASGRTLDLSGLPGIKVDKHSTGGVGDWISLALCPLVASLGVRVPMMAGRGLGHTGGTLDKLESIPGFQVNLSPEAFTSAVGRVGGVIAGQTADLAPLDKRMYALRDVTGTVESVPLIVSSILSKKKAEGIEALVMDVKCGRGAFMKTQDRALDLAQELCRVGDLLDLRVAAFITQMDRPLGNALGNALEVRASIDALQNRGAPDAVQVLRTLSTAMLCLAGRAETWSAGWEATAEALRDGSALNKFRQIVEEQGGDVAVIEDPGRLPRAPKQIPVPSPQGGYVGDIDPMVLALVVLDLGAGRRRAEESIRHDVGLTLNVVEGDRVEKGDTLAVIHGAGELPDLTQRVQRAFTLSAASPESRTMIHTLVTSRGHHSWKGAETWTRAFSESS